MQNAVLVRVMDGLGNRLDVTRSPARRQRSGARQLRQRLSLDIIHDQIMPVLAEADFVNGDDVGVLQTAGGGGFGAETEHLFLRRQRTVRQHLHRDDPIEADLPGAIDEAHAALADACQQFVAAETLREGFTWRVTRRLARPALARAK